MAVPTLADELLERAAAAKASSHALAQATTDAKNRGLMAMAAAIRAHEPAILAANAHDCAHASPRIEIDRLRLTPERVAAMARDVEAIAGLADPIGERFDSIVRPNGLRISKRRVPLGVVGVVYEARPNVTSDVAAICLKTGKTRESTIRSRGSRASASASGSRFKYWLRESTRLSRAL